jgi:hypothetical protein
LRSNYPVDIVNLKEWLTNQEIEKELGRLGALVISKVSADTFEDFLGLVSRLAEYEKLTPPDEEAKKRLRRDCLSDIPKFQALIGKIGGKPVSYVIYFFNYSSFLALPTLYLEDIFVL